MLKERGIVLLQARVRGFRVRKLFKFAATDFSKRNNLIVQNINDEIVKLWKGMTPPPKYDFKAGIDYFEREGVKLPLFLPLHELLWIDTQEYEESKKLKKKQEIESIMLRIKVLEEESSWIEDAIEKRIQFIENKLK